MALPQRKQNFMEGAAVLTLAVAVTKVMGAVYKIPLGNLLDKDGMAHFYVAYNIYSLLLIVSTAGLPLALSRLVLGSEAVFQIHAHGALGKIPQMAHTGLYHIVRPKIFSDRFRLGGRLHDHQIRRSCHE